MSSTHPRVEAEVRYGYHTAGEAIASPCCRSRQVRLAVEKMDVLRYTVGAEIPAYARNMHARIRVQRRVFQKVRALAERVQPQKLQLGLIQVAACTDGENLVSPARGRAAPSSTMSRRGCGLHLLLRAAMLLHLLQLLQPAVALGQHDLTRVAHHPRMTHSIRCSGALLLAILRRLSYSIIR